MKRIATIAFCALVACKSAPKTDAKIDFAAIAERAGVPRIGCVAVRNDGTVEAHDEEIAFEVASIGKPVIAVAVMQEVEAGRLSLDEDVARFAPFLGRRVTLRMLLTHTAAIVDDPLPERADVPLETVLRAHLPRAFVDGEPQKARYSNLGFALAAYVVERSSGLDYRAYTRDRIFAPLRMTRTGWRPSPPFALPQVKRDGRFVERAMPSHGVYPVVDLFSTPNDLARFARAMLRGGELDGARVLRDESVRAMLDGQLGWQSQKLGTHDALGHEGEDEGASTALFLDRKEKRAAVVLTNGDAFQSNDPSRIAALFSLLVGLLDAP